MYWLIYDILQMVFLDDIANWNCVLFQYFQTVVNCQEIYSLCNVSINRFCIILYHNKPLFKTQRWILTCIVIQWLIGVILPLPFFTISGQVIVNPKELKNINRFETKNKYINENHNITNELFLDLWPNESSFMVANLYRIDCSHYSKYAFLSD